MVWVPIRKRVCLQLRLPLYQRYRDLHVRLPKPHEYCPGTLSIPASFHGRSAIPFERSQVPSQCQGTEGCASFANSYATHWPRSKSRQYAWTHSVFCERGCGRAHSRYIGKQRPPGHNAAALVLPHNHRHNVCPEVPARCRNRVSDCPGPADCHPRRLRAEAGRMDQQTPRW
jgi:hypothetical protein